MWNRSTAAAFLVAVSVLGGCSSPTSDESSTRVSADAVTESDSTTPPSTEAGTLDLRPSTSASDSSASSSSRPQTTSSATGSDTTSSSKSDTTASTSDTTQQTTGTVTSPTSSTSTATSVPPSLVANTFAFTNGPAPMFAVVEAEATVEGDQFSIRFLVQSLDTWGFMTRLGIHSPVLGNDLCRDTVSKTRPLLPLQSVECRAGPFTTAGVESPIPLTFDDNTGYRQGTLSDGILPTPILPQRPVPGASIVSFYLVDGGAKQGFYVSDSTPATLVNLQLGRTTVSQPVAVDCSDTFDSGYSNRADRGPVAGVDPRIVAFRITRYNSAGRVTDPCEDIPEISLSFAAHLAFSKFEIHLPSPEG